MTLTTTPEGVLAPSDNPLIEDDSRRYGVADVIGRVLIRYYPRLGRLS